MGMRAQQVPDTPLGPTCGICWAHRNTLLDVSPFSRPRAPGVLSTHVYRNKLSWSMSWLCLRYVHPAPSLQRASLLMGPSDIHA
eukprot:SAG22_NODE_9551_length_583_cov_1.727273_1_plen_83_part_01